MKTYENVKITTEKLIQIPIDKKYKNDIFENFNSEITKYMYPKPSEDISETMQFIEESMKTLSEGTNMQMVILDKQTGEFLGCSGLHETNTKTPELGIWLKKEAHRKGYGLEAITALINWARENIVFEYIKYPVDKRNLSSRRIPEKNGGVIAREFKGINQSGNELDQVEYRIYY